MTDRTYTTCKSALPKWDLPSPVRRSDSPPPSAAAVAMLCRLRPPRPGLLKACILCVALLAGCLILRLVAPDTFGLGLPSMAAGSGAGIGGNGVGLRSLLPVGPSRSGSSARPPPSALAEMRTYYTLNDEHLDLHFGIVIDCGSSGSRLFVYAWPTHSGNEHQLLNIRPLAAPNGKRIVKKVSPGISDFAAKPAAAFEYLTPLLDFASSAIPKSKLVETPLYILCTAGMRLLPLAQQDAILTSVRTGVKRSYSFLFSDTHAEVISGKQEGVYAWITTNFLLGRFGHSSGDGVGLISYGADGHARKRTVGVIDMGGGSFQIAYEISPEAAAAMPSKEAVAEFNLGCRQSDTQHLHTLYVTTFLGYGANSARHRYEDTLVAEATAASSSSSARQNSTAQPPSTTLSLPIVADPCLPPGLNVTRPAALLTGTGNFTQCMHRTLPLLGRERPCKRQPCSLLGRHQPPIDFVKTEFVGFSEYWYCMSDVLGMGGHYDYASYTSAAARYCATSWEQLESDYREKKFPKADYHRLKFQCFKSAWIVAVLHHGLRFPRNYRKFQSVSAIAGTEVQWTLGAILHRTRYFPLREVQRLELDRQRHRGRRSSSLSNTYQYLLLLLSVLFVLLALFQLHRRLDLRRIPSAGYLT